MRQSKSILHITTVHPPDDNRIYYKECKSLTSDFKEVCLYSTQPFKGTPSEVKLIQYPSSQNRFMRMIWDSFFSLLKNTLFTTYDIYHFHDPEIIPAGLVLRIFGKKVIFDAHENLPGAIMSKPYLSNSIKKPMSYIIGRFEKFVSQFFSGLVVARPDIAEYLQNKNTCVVRNLPDLPAQSFPVKVFQGKDKFTLVYAGVMTRIRGIKELVLAMEYLDNVELALLGSIEETLKKECEALPGWKKVNYLGKVSADKVLDIVAKADVGIITFLPEPNHLTTLATKPFEYMACGLPMVMSDFPYWRDFFQDHATYVDPTSPQAIANGIKSVISDPRKMEEIGKKNQSIINQELNWENEAQKLRALYRKILE